MIFASGSQFNVNLNQEKALVITLLRNYEIFASLVWSSIDLYAQTGQEYHAVKPPITSWFSHEDLEPQLMKEDTLLGTWNSIML